jgi:transcriptional regulator GlxA family with amidase domain
VELVTVSHRRGQSRAASQFGGRRIESLLSWSALNVMVAFVSSDPSSRRLPRGRTDARHNADRIVRAAEQVFADSGVDVFLEEIARRAGVGAATLYRHFPAKTILSAL